MPAVVVPPAFKRRLRDKPIALQRAIVECMQRLGENPRHPSLQAHRVRGTAGVWEAYIDRANRMTFEYDEGRIILRNHCNHDIISRSP